MVKNNRFGSHSALEHFFGIRMKLERFAEVSNTILLVVEDQDGPWSSQTFVLAFTMETPTGAITHSQSASLLHCVCSSVS